MYADTSGTRPMVASHTQYIYIIGHDLKKEKKRGRERVVYNYMLEVVKITVTDFNDVTNNLNRMCVKERQKSAHIMYRVSGQEKVNLMMSTSVCGTRLERSRG